LDFALALGYITTETYEVFYEQYDHIIAQLITMERKADSFIQKKQLSSFVPRPKDSL